MQRYKSLAQKTCRLLMLTLVVDKSMSKRLLLSLLKGRTVQLLRMRTLLACCSLSSLRNLPMKSTVFHRGGLLFRTQTVRYGIGLHVHSSLLNRMMLDLELLLKISSQKRWSGLNQFEQSQSCGLAQVARTQSKGMLNLDLSLIDIRPSQNQNFSFALKL